MRRTAALVALALPVLMLVPAIDIAARQFPQGLVVAAGLAASFFAAWRGLLQRGAGRAMGVGVALLALVATVVFMIVRGGQLIESLVVVAGLALAFAAARFAFRLHVQLPEAPPPQRAVLFFNPRSGGGKAEKFDLATEAHARGIEPIELTRGADLERLVRDAVARGAEGLAMAGGDGSQAIVAAVAAELDLPYACIPAGTRNHFALDLGVDRDDVVGALDAFVNGGERRVDLAEVNGRVFVNNVSLGLYAEAVQREGYREAKLRTILDTVPDALGPNGKGVDLRWKAPDGTEQTSAAAILVSNNRYRLGRAIGSGTRPRMDEGVLGVAVVSAPPGSGEAASPKGWREWTAPRFEVDASGPIAAGVDGEALKLDPPLRFRSRPGALRVRIAPGHPGVSPSAAIPEGRRQGVRALMRIARRGVS